MLSGRIFSASGTDFSTVSSLVLTTLFENDEEDAALLKADDDDDADEVVASVKSTNEAGLLLESFGRFVSTGERRPPKRLTFRRLLADDDDDVDGAVVEDAVDAVVDAWS